MESGPDSGGIADKRRPMRREPERDEKQGILAALFIFCALFSIPGESPALILLGATAYIEPGCTLGNSRDLAVDASGNVFVADIAVCSGGPNWRVNKFDATLGTLLAATEYTGPITIAWPLSVALDGSGNPVVAGVEYGISTEQDWCILKYDPALGTLLGATSYNAPDNLFDNARSVAVDGGGNIFVTGVEYVSGQDYNWRTSKYDATLGTRPATMDYNGPTGTDEDQANAVAVDGSGNVVVVGYERDVGDNYNWRVIKYDTTLGTVLATTVYDAPSVPGLDYDEAWAVAIDGSGNIVVLGMEERPSGLEVMRIRKYAPSLAILLATTAYISPADSHAYGNDVVIDGSGNIVVAGCEVNSGGTLDLRILKYDATLSTVLATTVYNGPGNANEEAEAVAIDASGDIYVAGRGQDASGTTYYSCVRKYGQESASLWASVQAVPGSVKEGECTWLCLTVTNGGTAAATNLVPRLEANWGGGLVTLISGPAPSSWGTLGPGQVTTFTWTWSAAGWGTVGFTATVTGYNTGLSATIWAAASAVLDIAPADGALVIDSLALSPASPQVNSTVLATLVVRNPGSATVAVTGVSRTSTGGVSEMGSFSILSPLAGGATMTLSWTHATGGTCGPGSVQVSVDGYEEGTLAERRAGPRNSNAVSIRGVPVSIVLTAPSTVYASEEGKLTARLRDSCGLAVTGATVHFVVARGNSTIPVGDVISGGSGEAQAALHAWSFPEECVVRAYLDTPALSATALVEVVNPLLLDSPGAALNVNVFSPRAGEIMLARVWPRSDGKVKVRVFTGTGRLVRELKLSEPIGSGQFTVKWDGKTEQGYVVARGVYLVHVRGGGLNEVLRVVVR